MSAIERGNQQRTRVLNLQCLSSARQTCDPRELVKPRVLINREVPLREIKLQYFFG